MSDDVVKKSEHKMITQKRKPFEDGRAVAAAIIAGFFIAVGILQILNQNVDVMTILFLITATPFTMVALGLLESRFFFWSLSGMFFGISLLRVIDDHIDLTFWLYLMIAITFIFLSLDFVNRNSGSAIMAFIFLFAFFWPLINGDIDILTYFFFSFTLVFLFAAMSLTLNLEVGYLGIPNFGKVAFVAVGAYTYAIVLDEMVGTGTEFTDSEYYTAVVIGLVLSMIVSGIFGILLTLPTLKLREDYLAIVTIVAGEIVRNVANNEERLGEFAGFSVDNPATIQFGSSAIIEGAFLDLGPLILTFVVIGLTHAYLFLRTPSDAEVIKYERDGRIQRAITISSLTSVLIIVLDYFSVFGDPSLGLHIILMIFVTSLIIYRVYATERFDIYYLLYGFYIVSLISFAIGFTWNPHTNIKLVDWFKMLIALFTLLFVYVAMEEIYHSPFGRTLRAIREDDTSAISVGKSIFGYRLRALVIASALTGLTGAVYAQVFTIVAPLQFQPLLTFTLYIMLIIGGTGNNKGVIYGAFVIQILFQITRGTLIADSAWFYPDMRKTFGEFFEGNLDYISGTRQIEASNIAIIVVGVFLIVFLIYAPDGILPEVKKNNEKYYNLSNYYEGKDEEDDRLLDMLVKLTKTEIDAEEWIQSE